MSFVFAFARDMKARIDRLSAWLATFRAQCVVLAAATTMAATSLGTHRSMDDWVLGIIARGRGGPIGLNRNPLDLFTFTTGDPAANHRLMDVGVMLPWWTEPRLRIAFFRPVSSLTHWIDEHLLGASALVMHLHSLVWYAALLGAVLVVYRRLASTPVVAGLAFFFYAFDDAHAWVLSWIANRNALIAACFGCLALAAHDASRRGGKRGAAVLSVALWAVALLAGESAVGALAYLIAYAVFLEGGSSLRRAGSIGWHGAVLVVWRLFWGRTYGVFGSGAYIDPGADPLRFLAVLPERLSLVIHAQFSFPPADVAFLGPPTQHLLVVVLAATSVVVMGWLFLPQVRKDPRSRFWAAGMLIAAAPLASTFPSDRMLLFVGLGGMALLAQLVHAFVSASERVAGSLRPLLILALAGFHGIIEPCGVPIRAMLHEQFGRVHDRAAAVLDGEPDLPSKTVVVVSAPVVVFTSYIQVEREYLGLPRPAHLYLLSDASSPTEVTRSGASELSLRPREGFLYSPLERHYRATPLPVGTETVLSTMTARVVAERSDGRPDRVTFRFDGPASAYVFLTWKEGRFVPFNPPAEGGSIVMPEEDFGNVVLRASLESDEPSK